MSCKGAIVAACSTLLDSKLKVTANHRDTYELLVITATYSSQVFTTRKKMLVSNSMLLALAVLK